MLSMRLMRFGAKKKPFYRIVVMDSRRPRQSKAKEIIGYYDPLQEPPVVEVDFEKADFWLSKGAQASKTVHSLLHKFSKSQKLSNQHSKA